MAEVDFRRLKVLVVEDNDFVRFMIKKYLTEYGVPEIMEAANGMEGVNMLFGAPDIVICDINMEPLNGFEFLQHVRALGTENSKVPIIFLTSNASSDFVQKAIDLTVDAYILKPVTTENLRNKMAALLSRRPAGKSASSD